MRFDTPEEFEDWLKEQPREICTLIAARMALRLFPDLTHEPKTAKELGLTSARALLTSYVVAQSPSSAVSAVAKVVATKTGKAARSFYLEGASSGDDEVAFANAAADAIYGDASTVAYYIEDFDFAIDEAHFDCDLEFDALLSAPLWRVMTHGMREASYREVTDILPGWTFWREWYQGLLDGKPLDWELQRRVALIEEAIWEAGPEAVAEEIERIRAHYALELEIAKLKENFRSVATSDTPAHRLHNQPPEAVEGEMQAVRREITLVWNKIEELEVEIVKPDPSPSKLNKIAQSLWDISIRIGKYCGGKVDKALDESAKVIGKTGTQAAIAYLTATTAAQNESVKSVAKAIWEFAKTLPPG